MTDKIEGRPAPVEQEAGRIHTGANAGRNDKPAITSYAPGTYKVFGFSENSKIALDISEIGYLMNSGKTYTAKQISEILLMPLPEVEQTLRLMVKLGEVEADVQALTYYRVRR